MLAFLHTYHPSPILFSLGPINIYWYGLFIVLGILAAFLVALKLAGYYGIKRETVFDLAFYLIISGIIGARIYYVLLEWQYYLAHPLNIFKIWQGGLAIHGAIIGGIWAVYFFSKKYKVNFGLMASLIAPGLALAQAIGRWGNYFNQELFGQPTDLPWGIPIDVANRPFEYISSEFFHPAFLYESMGNFLIFIILIIIHYLIIKRVKTANKFSIINPPALICEAFRAGFQLSIFVYLFFYSILRFAIEFIRVDKTPIFFNLRLPQIISLLIIAMSIVALLKNFRSHDNINTALTQKPN